MSTFAWPLLGRDAERAAIDELLAAVRDGLSGALLLTGEAGIGKTRLLEYAAAAGADLRVVWLTGVESETQLAFGALHRLLRPFLDPLPGLPAPQRDALSAAFGLAGGEPPDRYLAGLATLTVLACVAADQPVLVLVDDVHWLDRESAEALAFTARRLHADSLAFVFAARPRAAGRTGFDAIAARRLGGLEPLDATVLLALGVTGSLDPAVAGRLVAGTGGNPLALIELMAQLSPEQFAGVAPLPARLPVSRMLDAYFRTDIGALPADTRKLLLLIAAAPADDAVLIWRAAGKLGLSARAADAAAERGIVTRQSRPEFRHPLIRSAVYSEAGLGQRREVHAALAAACDSAGYTERSAWHRAEAAAGPDDQAAAGLAAAAERAGARGGHSERALFLSRAAELTTVPDRRAERLLAAADAHVISGNPAAAEVLLDMAVADLSGPVPRARALRTRAVVEMFHVRVANVPAMLLDAVVELGAQDPRMTWDLLFEAMHAALMARERVSGTTLLDVAKLTAAAWHDPDAPGWSADLIMEGLARRVAEGHAWGLGLLARCQALMSTDEHAEARYRDSLELLGQVPVGLDLAHTRLLFGEWLRRRRRRGEARGQLRAAHQLFASCGAVPFAERARAELLCTGEQVSKRTVPARNELTPQERHVAVLAAGGSTNAEIASRLFITVSTVEFHLNKVFRKLGISSRRQIAARVRAGDPLAPGSGPPANLPG